MLKLTALGVGHGDATLLQVFSPDDSEKPAFTCLVDGGESPTKLASALDRHGVGDLDLLVLSHFDADHISGLDDIWKRRKVQSYWAPCLAAFERHAWLFGKRIQSGLAHARQVEESLRASGTQVTYPLEGFSSSPVKDGQFSLHVLSPAARLMRTLLLDRDIEWLFTQTPMPLGWLASPEPAAPIEQPTNELNLDHRLRNGALAPEDVDWVRPDGAKPGMSDVQKQSSARAGIEPEFFGDSVLNNTSLVVWLNIGIGARSHKVLLTGDQENWTYLLMRHPLGLQVDLLKSPHHGGQLYIEQGLSNEEILSSIRPRAVLFSANGRHGLPHSDMRASAMRWGASVFCTSQRGAEVILANRPEQQDTCCHRQFSCSSDTQDMAIIFDEQGIHANRAACHTGFGTSPGPIIQISQHTVERSTVVQHLHEGELRKHLGWLKKVLQKVHRERSLTVSKGGQCEAIGLDEIATIARASGRHNLVFDLERVLAEGWQRGELWSSGTNRRYGDKVVAYALPSKEVIKSIGTWPRSKLVLIFGGVALGYKDVSTLIAGLDHSELADSICGEYCFPREMFRETLWPAIYRELVGWNRYLHSPSNSLWLSKSPSVHELCSTFLANMFESCKVGVSMDSRSNVLMTGISQTWDQMLFRSPKRYGSGFELREQFVKALNSDSEKVQKRRRERNVEEEHLRGLFQQKDVPEWQHDIYFGRLGKTDYSTDSALDNMSRQEVTILAKALEGDFVLVKSRGTA